MTIRQGQDGEVGGNKHERQTKNEISRTNSCGKCPWIDSYSASQHWPLAMLIKADASCSPIAPGRNQFKAMMERLIWVSSNATFSDI